MQRYLNTVKIHGDVIVTIHPLSSLAFESLELPLARTILKDLTEILSFSCLACDSKEHLEELCAFRDTAVERDMHSGRKLRSSKEAPGPSV